ncbi:hypothetical protein EMEDMD4_940026 [Sinorhizobium medicae]|uniref:Uncharacterized protein n=1 Tax=Sinorhizobium medicae TaxID=110321 RepID=A0A508X8A7_9HYPH|nr:hypothetical protein EMEDMD4_940026 [Sinorhizobium medicae]
MAAQKAIMDERGENLRRAAGAVEERANVPMAPKFHASKANVVGAHLRHATPLFSPADAIWLYPFSIRTSFRAHAVDAA